MKPDQNVYLLFICMFLIFNSCDWKSENTQHESITTEDSIIKHNDSTKINQEEVVKDLNSTAYKKYCNVRFDFCVQYPPNFISKGVSDNEDGQHFVSENGKAELTVWGSNMNFSMEEEAKMAEHGKKITYSRMANNYYVLSGINGEGNVFYQKTITSPSSKVSHSFMMEYPQSEKSTFDSVCTKMADMFE